MYTFIAYVRRVVFRCALSLFHGGVRAFRHPAAIFRRREKIINNNCATKQRQQHNGARTYYNDCATTAHAQQSRTHG